MGGEGEATELFVSPTPNEAKSNSLASAWKLCHYSIDYRTEEWGTRDGEEDAGTQTNPKLSELVEVF